MGDAVIRVRSHLQALARDNWAYVEEKHVNNVSWLRDELKQIARSMELKARLKNKPPVAPAPYPSLSEPVFKTLEPAKKKQKTESRRESAVPVHEAPSGRRMSTRLSMRLHARSQSVESVRVVKNRKRGRPSEDLLQNPWKLKVVEMRTELKKRGLRTSGVKAVLLDRLLDALEKEQKETSHLIKVEEEQEQEQEENEAEVIVIDDDEDEIVRESVGSTKSPRSQSSPKAAQTLVESATDGKSDTSGAATTDPAPSTASAALDIGEVASKEDSDQNQRDFEENDHSASRHGIEFTNAERTEGLIAHDNDTRKRKSVQLSGKSELTSPLAWKRKSILRKASSLAPTARLDRKVSFAANDEVNMIVELSQADSNQTDLSSEKAPSLPEVYTPREESKQARSDSPSEAEPLAAIPTTPAAFSSTSTTPEDRPKTDSETEEQRRKRKFDETVKREAEKLRAAAKLSAQKRLEEAKASKAFWAKRDQLKAKLRASYAEEKRKSAHTPVALSEKPASDQISPPTSEISTAAESIRSASDTKRPISPALVTDTRPQDAMTREEALDNDFMRSMARRQEVESISDVSSAFESSMLKAKAPRSTYSVVEDKLQAERSTSRRVADKSTAKSMPLTAGQSTESTQLWAAKSANKPDLPSADAVEPVSTRDRSDSLSSTVSSIPEPSVVENALRSGAATAASAKRKPIANLVSGLHSFTTLLEKENPQESNNGRSAPVVNALKLAERSRLAEEKKRLEKEKRKAILKQKMEEHKKAAALKEKTEKDAQTKREQERLNERKKREAELARRRQQKLKEMRAGLEKKRAMLAAEKKSKIAAMASKSTATSSQHKHRGLVHASDTSQPTTKPPMQKPVQKPVPKAPQALTSAKSAPAPKLTSKPSTKNVPRPPMSPAPAKQAPKSHSPEIVNYEMSDNAESSGGDSSDSDSGRHGKKKVPRWAQRDHLNKILHAQFGKNATNPSPAIFQDFVDTCNLEAIFETTDIRKKKKFARRTSSGNWLADRPTARDKALYQRDMGYDR